MLSPEAPLLEESLAASALTLSVCSQFINTAQSLPPLQPREAGRLVLGWGPTKEPDPVSPTPPPVCWERREQDGRGEGH